MIDLNKSRWRILFLWLLISSLIAGCGQAAEPEVTATPAPTATAQPSPTPDPSREGWALTWHDEFDGPEIDTSVWIHETGGDGWGNGENQYYTDWPENSFIEDGHLVIEAREQNHLGKRWTSARLKTEDTFEQAYGRFEARIKIPTGQGLWPAFWMLGANHVEIGWPYCGEIDIMENIGSEPATIHGTVHGPGYSGGNGRGGPRRLYDGAIYADDFHVFAIEWEEEEIRWYVDDDLYFQLTPAGVPGEWVYDHPFFLILNVAVGGEWPGYPDGTAEFPQQMRVDYVRVYEREQ